MVVTSTAEAGALVKSLRENAHMSRKELSEASGVPLRTVYAIEGGEGSNLGLDRLVALLAVLGAQIDIIVPAANRTSASVSSSRQIIDEIAGTPVRFGRRHEGDQK